MTRPAQNKRPLHPREAATLIILRHPETGAAPQLLMGKRHEAHKFLPNKFVFPGGRADAGDGRVAAASELHPSVAGKLMTKMRGVPSPCRARGLAMAAVRETFEETGLIVGQPSGPGQRTRSKAWRPFFATGNAPALGGLCFFARAITPPGRPRRFDTRFFVTDASEVANINRPEAVGTEELLDLHWFTFKETEQLDLPWITGQIIARLKAALQQTGGVTPGMPCTYQRMVSGNWVYEDI